MGIRTDHFNEAEPSILHIDLNSCFATVEQQAKPLLRGKVIGVAPFTGRGGTVIAPSIEAKRVGIKTGMRIWECINIYPKMIILPPDPPKYRFVHMRIRHLLEQYSPKVVPKSIDEFVVDFSGTPSFRRGLVETAQEIKDRIRSEIGGHLTTSVGIATNRTLAKLAAGLHKPDGLEVIDQHNFLDIYRKIGVRDLPGIDVGFSRRLATIGVFTVPEMLERSYQELHQGFKSIVGEDWYARIRVWEVDDLDTSTKSFSNQRVQPAIIQSEQILKVLFWVLWKATTRMRIAGFQGRRLSFGMFFRSGAPWEAYQRLPQSTFSGTELFEVAQARFLAEAPREYVTQVFCGVSELKPLGQLQLETIANLERTQALYRAVDAIDHKYGRNTIKPARMLGTEGIASHRIPFNSVKDMEDYLFNGEDLLDE